MKKIFTLLLLSLCIGCTNIEKPQDPPFVIGGIYPSYFEYEDYSSFHLKYSELLGSENPFLFNCSYNAKTVKYSIQYWPDDMLAKMGNPQWTYLIGEITLECITGYKAQLFFYQYNYFDFDANKCSFYSIENNLEICQKYGGNLIAINRDNSKLLFRLVLQNSNEDEELKNAIINEVTNSYNSYIESTNT